MRAGRTARFNFGGFLEFFGPRFFRFESKVFVEESVKLFPYPLHGFYPGDRRLNIEDTGRRKLGNVAELLLQVKNFFLQMQDFSRSQLRQFHAILCRLQFAP
jgi:hypothetical protein